MPTKQQDDWVAVVFQVDMAALASATPANGGGGGPIGETGQTGDCEKVGVAPLVAVVIGGVEYLTRELIANVTIRMLGRGILIPEAEDRRPKIALNLELPVYPPLLKRIDTC